MTPSPQAHAELREKPEGQMDMQQEINDLRKQRDAANASNEHLELANQLVLKANDFQRARIAALEAQVAEARLLLDLHVLNGGDCVGPNWRARVKRFLRE